MKPKNPGLGARLNPVQAALAVHKNETPTAETADKEQLVVTSVRLPKSMHQALRRISFEDEVSIHSLLIEGIELLLAKRKK